jgi:Esterase-like activity of phytase
MIAAIRPNDVIIPMRNGSESFSADSPTFYASEGAGIDMIPTDNPTGRDSNHGFEGLTVTGDGNTLYVLLQAAANQVIRCFCSFVLGMPSHDHCLYSGDKTNRADSLV